MAKQQKPKRKKNAKKKFFEVTLPLTTTKVHLYSYSPEDLEGSTVKLDLTKNLRGKNMELKAKISLKNENLTGEIISLQLLQTYVKKIVRRSTDYVEDSFIASCKDSKLQIKPILVTRRRVSRAVKKAIRTAAKKHIESKITPREAEEIFADIMSNKFQKELSLKVKKVYPLAACEIRRIKILEKTTPQKATTPKENKEPSEEKANSKE